MKTILLTLAAVALMISYAFATASIGLPVVPYPVMVDPTRPAIQMFSPGPDVTSLSVAGSTTDLSKYTMYSLYSASGTCYMRLLPTSTSNKASYTAVPIPNTTWRNLAVNRTAAFINMSGCVGGFIQKQ